MEPTTALYHAALSSSSTSGYAPTSCLFGGMEVPTGGTGWADEWEFVVSPDPNRTYAERDGFRTAHPNWCRKAIRYDELLAKMAAKNAELEGHGHTALVESLLAPEHRQLLVLEPDLVERLRELPS